VTKSLYYNPFEDSDHEEGYEYLSDSDLEDDVEVAEPITNNSLPRKENQNSGADEKCYNELDHQGKVVVLRGVSYLTLVKV
jgi:hypothetical protein